MKEKLQRWLDFLLTQQEVIDQKHEEVIIDEVIIDLDSEAKLSGRHDSLRHRDNSLRHRHDSLRHRDNSLRQRDELDKCIEILHSLNVLVPNTVKAKRLDIESHIKTYNNNSEFYLNNARRNNTRLRKQVELLQQNLDEDVEELASACSDAGIDFSKLLRNSFIK